MNSCCEKDNPPSSMFDDIDKESKSLDDLEKVYDEIQNLETTGSGNNILVTIIQYTRMTR